MLEFSWSDGNELVVIALDFCDMEVGIEFRVSLLTVMNGSNLSLSYSFCCSFSHGMNNIFCFLEAIDHPGLMQY